MPQERIAKMQKPKELSKKKKAEISPIPVPVVAKADNKETARKAENAKKVRLVKPKSKMTDAELEELKKQSEEAERLHQLGVYDQLKKDRAQIPENLNTESLAAIDHHIEEIRNESLTGAQFDAEDATSNAKALKGYQELQSKLKADRMILLRTDNFETFVEVLTEQIKDCGEEIDDLLEVNL